MLMLMLLQIDSSSFITISFYTQCQAKAEESEPYGWWDCTIKTVRDNVEYPSNSLSQSSSMSYPEFSDFF